MHLYYKRHLDGFVDAFTTCSTPRLVQLCENCMKRSRCFISTQCWSLFGLMVLAQETLSVANGITHSDAIAFVGRRFCDEQQHLLIRKELNIKGHANAAIFRTTCFSSLAQTKLLLLSELIQIKSLSSQLVGARRTDAVTRHRMGAESSWIHKDQTSNCLNMSCSRFEKGRA